MFFFNISRPFRKFVEGKGENSSIFVYIYKKYIFKHLKCIFKLKKVENTAYIYIYIYSYARLPTNLFFGGRGGGLNHLHFRF